MPLRLRFLLDTNILIPLQDSFVALKPNLANFVRLANLGGHQLLYHPSSEAGIRRDVDVARRNRTLARLRQYSRLQDGPACPWNNTATSPNDACDNEILYALENEAVHALVTEDQKLHSNAKARGLGDRVYFIQSVEDWLRRLHEPAQVVLPNIQDVEMHTLTARLRDPFFDSLRDAYDGFDTWFRAKAQQGRRAWIYKTQDIGPPSAMCIYDVQHDERINDAGDALPRAALKMCTFKVGEAVRGRKIGELFLRAAFRYATDHKCEHIFIHADPSRHAHLIALLDDFGFVEAGVYGRDRAFVKRHPIDPPAVDIPPFDYFKRFYPHYRSGIDIRKFIVPIQPQYHGILFPDYENPGAALPANHPRTHVGNAVKLAYLCHAPNKQVRRGDVVLFYRTRDLKAITTLGVVEHFEVSQSAADIARLVSRRTVYSQREIVDMAERPTKVILFRLIEHLPNRVSYEWLRQNRVVHGYIQSIRTINDESFSRILRAAER
ncbi:MAG: GNAT family N-acetyltransferase [Opitutaceae bacterium]